MIENPLISVIIPTFNREQILLRTIKNVLQQTWKKIEIIIVNDGLAMDLKNEFFSLSNNKIIYIKTKRNLGCANSRSLGVGIAKGDFIAFLDDDDEWESNYLKNQLDIFKIDNSIDFVISNYKINFFNKFYEIRNMQPYINNFKKKILESPGPFFQCCLFKKKILTNINQFLDTKSIPSEDWDFFINLSYINPRIGHSDKIGFIWNLSDKSQSSNLLKEAKGINYLISKHKNNIIDYCGFIVLSDHYRRIARIYEKLHMYKKIKFFYKKAFITAPFHWKNFLYFLILLFGKTCYLFFIKKIRNQSD